MRAVLLGTRPEMPRPKGFRFTPEQKAEIGKRTSEAMQPYLAGLRVSSPMVRRWISQGVMHPKIRDHAVAALGEAAAYAAELAPEGNVTQGQRLMLQAWVRARVCAESLLESWWLDHEPKHLEKAQIWAAQELRILQSLGLEAAPREMIDATRYIHVVDAQSDDPGADS